MNQRLWKSAATYGVISVGVLLISTACVVRTYSGSSRSSGTTTTTTGGTTTVTVTTPQPQVAAGVTVIEASCDPNAVEACDGLDNNCNGAIDEGCGYSTGRVQITAAWPNGADIDLYVTDPNNETISYAHPRSSSGGHLDRDARGACTGGAPDGYQQENVYWGDSGTPPPSGQYKVDLHYYSPCGVAGATPVNLSISVDGRVIGQYSYTLRGQNDRVTLAQFQL